MKKFSSASIMSIFFLFFLTARLPGCRSQSHPNEKEPASVFPGEGITDQELRLHAAFLASDELGGRAINTTGYRRAARYAEEEFRSAGLKPLIQDPMESSSYFQQVPFLIRDPGDQGRMVLSAPWGKVELSGGIDFKFIRFREEGFYGLELPVVFAGHGILEPDQDWNDAEGLELSNAIAVILPGLPHDRGLPQISEQIRRYYSSGSGLQRKAARLFAAGAAAVIVIENKNPNTPWNTRSDAVDRIHYVYTGGDRGDLNPTAQIQGRRKTLITAKKNLLDFLLQEYDTSKLNQDYEEWHPPYRSHAEVQARFRFSGSNKTFQSPNVCALLEGSDPVLRKEYISIGAHLDHLPPLNGEIFNGADDNASGCAGVLEIAEELAKNPLRRSVIFVLFTGEENGLCGSRYFVKDCPVQVEAIQANLTLDMIGRTSQEQEESRGHYAFAGADICREFEEFIRSTNGEPPVWPLVYQRQELAPGVSDHLSFMVHGIPSVFFCSGLHKDVHRPTDDPEKLEYDKMTRISQLVFRLALGLAEKDGIPCRK